MTTLAQKNQARRRLASPTLAMLPRVADSLSFLYLDAVRVVQDDTGVCARVGPPGGGSDRVYLPTAALSCVLLGPGTSITQPALATLARHGTTVVCAGSGGVRAYAGIQPSSLTTHWLEKQALAWASEDQRVTVATRMYLQRFGDGIPPGASLAQLRGIEGQRIKTLYKLLAQKHKIARFRRNYDPAAWALQDPVNLALSAANTCLYGVVHSAILAIGCSAALGFIHSGTQHAFVYDVADLYKAQITIPLAFSLHSSTRPEQDARRRLREEFRLFKLLPRIVADIQQLLDPGSDTGQPDRNPDLVHLWDPELGELPAGVNYADDT
jgi:CRISPR-associated protein Cas1